MNLKKLNEDITKLLHEAEGEEVTFADVFGEDLTGQIYEGKIDVSGKGLTSLKGAPKEVTVNFNCSNNNLTSLEYAPEKVGYYFYCSNNALTSLEGAPKEVGAGFYCDNNNLTSLAGINSIGRLFVCSNNKLTTLEGFPESTWIDFYCNNNNLTSLKGSPEKVGTFECNNNNLTSLEGAPKEVDDWFSCENNNLTSLKGFPKKVRVEFYCQGNPNLTEEDFAPIMNRVKKGIYADIDLSLVKKPQNNKEITLAVVDDGSYEQHLIAKKEGKVWVVEDDLNDAFSGQTFTTLPKLYKTVAEQVADGIQGSEAEYLDEWLGEHDEKFYNYLLKAMKKNGYDPDDESNADDIW